MFSNLLILDLDTALAVKRLGPTTRALKNTNKRQSHIILNLNINKLDVEGGTKQLLVENSPRSTFAGKWLELPTFTVAPLHLNQFKL